MWSVSFLGRCVTAILLVVCTSCSDPIFWILERELPISKNNLPKGTQATGIGLLHGRYYASVGPSLWSRPVAGGAWAVVPFRFPGAVTSVCSNLAVAGGAAAALYVGTVGGVYSSTDGTNFVRIATLGADAAYAVDYLTAAGVTAIYAVTSSGMLGRYNVYQRQADGAFNLYCTLNGALTGAGTLGVSSNNGIFNAVGNEARVAFGTVSGYDANYLYADGQLGTYADPGGWILSVDSGYPAGRGTTVFDLSTRGFVGDIRALFSVYGIGYFELYDQGGALHVRSPTSTVSSKDAYQASNLAFATIVKFVYHNNDLFALTTRQGLWRNAGGTWIQE